MTYIAESPDKCHYQFHVSLIIIKHKDSSQHPILSCRQPFEFHNLNPSSRKRSRITVLVYQIKQYLFTSWKDKQKAERIVIEGKKIVVQRTTNLASEFKQSIRLISNKEFEGSRVGSHGDVRYIKNSAGSTCGESYEHTAHLSFWPILHPVW
jgi:hypothetical protein